MLFLIASLIIISSTLACPPWTTSFNNKCYVFRSTGITWGYDWFLSEEGCNCLGGHLVTIDNAIENSFIYNNVKHNKTWIGATYFNGQYQGWIWSEGKVLNKYQNWAKGQLLFDSCAYMNESSWHTPEYCAEDPYSHLINNYVCQIPQDGLFCPRASIDSNNSLSYWTYYNSINTCFQSDFNQYNFTEASTKCDQYLSIHSEKEMEIVSYYLNTVIGLAEVPGTDRYFTIWVGLWDPYKNGSWQWLDGSKVDYTNWAIGQPGTSDDCAYFDYYTYKWMSRPCYNQGLAICQTEGKLQSDQSLPSTCENIGSSRLYRNQNVVRKKIKI